MYLEHASRLASPAPQHEGVITETTLFSSHHALAVIAALSQLLRGGLAVVVPAARGSALLLVIRGAEQAFEEAAAALARQIFFRIGIRDGFGIGGDRLRPGTVRIIVARQRQVDETGMGLSHHILPDGGRYRSAGH